MRLRTGWMFRRRMTVAVLVAIALSGCSAGDESTGRDSGGAQELRAGDVLLVPVPPPGNLRDLVGRAVSGETVVTEVIDSTAFWVGNPDTPRGELLIVLTDAEEIEKGTPIAIDGTLATPSPTDRTRFAIPPDDHRRRTSSVYVRADEVTPI